MSSPTKRASHVPKERRGKKQGVDSLKPIARARAPFFPLLFVFPYVVVYTPSLAHVLYVSRSLTSVLGGLKRAKERKAIEEITRTHQGCQTETNGVAR